jgi:ubiquinone/menaquinone biosynthesis C-methylase UbiE
VVGSFVKQYADRVLDNAGVSPGMTLVDVGSGDGLVAFRAIERVGPTLRVILTDISAPLIRYAESVAVQRSVRTQCTFIECSGERLEGIPDGAADVVVTRASLAYLPDKTAALREFYRVLKPGGRISLAEPILQDDAFYTRALRKRVAEQSSPTDRFLPLLHRWKAAQFPDTAEKCAASPICNFSERDLINFAGNAGFAQLHLQLHIDVMPSLTSSWAIFLETSPHPLAPSLRRIMADQFSPEECCVFEQAVRPMVESGKSISSDRVAYLQATKL